MTRRSFQLKLNSRVIVTNVQLHGFGLVNSNLCTFCEMCAETTLHFLNHGIMTYR